MGGVVNYLCQGTNFRVWIADKNGLGYGWGLIKCLISVGLIVCTYLVPVGEQKWAHGVRGEEGDDGLSKCIHFHEMDQTRNLYAINTCNIIILYAYTVAGTTKTIKKTLETVIWMHIIGLHDNCMRIGPPNHQMLLGTLSLNAQNLIELHYWTISWMQINWYRIRIPKYV